MVEKVKVLRLGHFTLTFDFQNNLRYERGSEIDSPGHTSRITVLTGKVRSTCRMSAAPRVSRSHAFNATSWFVERTCSSVRAVWKSVASCGYGVDPPAAGARRPLSSLCTTPSAVS